jgi:MoxR-like ATPase
MEKQHYVHPIEKLQPVADSSEMLKLETDVRKVFVDELIRQYIASLVAATRNHTSVRLGASPRGSLALFRTSQARALIQGRDYVLPDDVKYMAEPVLAHRLILHSKEQSVDRTGRNFIAELLEKIPVPGTVVKR